MPLVSDGEEIAQMTQLHVSPSIYLLHMAYALSIYFTIYLPADLIEMSVRT
jgi:hypothetical protein